MYTDIPGRSKILLVLKDSRAKSSGKAKKVRSVMISQIHNHFSSLNV